MILTPVLWTLASAISFACCYVLARRGTAYCSVALGTTIATGMNLILMTVWALSATPWEVLTDGRLLPFCIIGLFSPGLARLLLILGVQRVGASRSSSIRAAGPLVATVIAVLWLGESPTPLNLAGMSIIVLGGIFLSKKSRGEPLWERKDMIFPVAGTLLTALRDVVVRFGLRDFPYPVAGSWAATGVSTIVVLIYWGWTRPPKEKAPPLAGWIYFMALGVGVSLGFTTLLFALRAGEVVIVSPIAGAVPLFTILLSAVFLRDVEKLTVPLITGSFLIVLGVVLVALRF